MASPQQGAELDGRRWEEEPCTPQPPSESPQFRVCDSFSLMWRWGADRARPGVPNARSLDPLRAIKTVMRPQEFLLWGPDLFLTFPKAFWKAYSQCIPSSLEPHQLGAVTLIKGTHWQSSALQMRQGEGKAIIS